MVAVLMIHDAMVRRLEAVANTDALTGVMSRKAWLEAAAHELARCARGGAAPALLIIDLDRFKNINDTYGHDAGDAVLQAFARLAAGQVRATDSIGRLGGEEFAVLLPATTEAEALQLTERIRAAAECHQVEIEAGGGAVRCTLSGGIACLRPDESLSQFSARADAALYRAKLGGRNRIVVHGGAQGGVRTGIEMALPA